LTEPPALRRSIAVEDGAIDPPPIAPMTLPA